MELQKTVTFTPVSVEAEKVVPRPVPAKEMTPEWFKNIPAFANGGKAKFGPDGSADKTVKMCVPFADGFRMGYIQCTWMDLEVVEAEDGSGNIRIVTPGKPEMLNSRPKPNVVMPPEYHQLELVWRTQWMPVLPKGYSALITHPLNRDELPFKTLSGVVDYDAYHHDTENNLPFFLKKGFLGRIPIGTPMYQIIPFKRDEWVSTEVPYSEDQKWEAQKMFNRFWGAYRNLFWSKKSFK